MNHTSSVSYSSLKRRGKRKSTKSSVYLLFVLTLLGNIAFGQVETEPNGTNLTAGTQTISNATTITGNVCLGGACATSDPTDFWKINGGSNGTFIATWSDNVLITLRDYGTDASRGGAPANTVLTSGVSQTLLASNYYSISVQFVTIGVLTSYSVVLSGTALPAANNAPTDITLTPSSVNQSTTGVNSTIGTLSSTDADGGDSHTYTEVSGTGDTDNGSFNISGSTLRADGALAAGSYSVRINTNDGTDDFAKAITVTVVDNIAPTVTSVSSSTANGTYKVGDVVAVTVTFSETVTVTGTPQITLETGTTDRTVNYSSGSGGTTLTFNYTVQSGDVSSDLDYTSTTALALNSGTIKDAAGNDATLTLPTPGAANSLAANKALVIDTTSPTVTGVSSSTANGTYKVGDVVAVIVTFSEAVTVTGTPQITLETGTTDRTVNYSSGSGGTTLTFNYTVQSGDVSSDLDYTSTTALALNSGTIKDGAGNDATLTLSSPGTANSLGANKALVIDTTSPTVTVVSSSTANGTYKVGDVVAVTVTFSEAVTVTGTPQITLETGTTDRTVNYSSGSGGTTLTFNYTIQSGDVSSGLDYTSTTALALNSGTIKDGAGNDATLTLASPGAANSLGANKALVIDGVAPTVTGVSSSTANGTYKVGDAVTVTVTFSEAVTVTGTPQLTLETGATDRTVNYSSGSGGATLTFNYTVQSGDVSSDLDYTSTTALALNSGTIKDGTGNDATLTLASPGAANSLGANKALVIDGVVPTVSSVNASTANGTYGVGSVISIDVIFSEAVTITNTPQLTLETGTTDRTVNYSEGSGTSFVTFKYTIQAGDVSTDLDYLSTSALALNGGTIKDAAGNDATLTLPTPGATNSLGANKALVIDGVAPTVTGVSSSTANGTYKVGDVVAVTVTFSEAVTVTGTPQITLETGTTDRTVNYSSGSGGTTLTFNYTIQSGDVSSDLDYTSTTALALNSGTIKDAADNDATLTLASPGAANSLGSNKALVIDGVTPTVTGVSSSTANGTYKVGDVVAVTVTFSEAVTVTGTPQITLETGTTDRTVNYSSGSGGTTLTFNYTVQAGDVSSDLDYTSTTALALNSGTIKDGAGNDATLTLASPGAANSLGANKALVIDGVAPTVTSVSSTKTDGTYGIGESITITVTFSESVTVTGTPQLALETGAVDRTINYASGSGTNTLSFAYTTQSGDESTDLDYKATNSLSLNGGAIKDGAGNDATLTLASPGAANSLGANKAIVISAFPTVSLSVGSASITEAAGTSTVTATLSQTSSQDVVVTLAYSGTAANGTDYNSSASTSITITAGQLSANAAVGITATQDTDAEGNETIIIDITGVSKATEDGVQQKTITINDDDAAVVTSVSSTTADGSYKAGDVIAVTVTFNLPVIVTGTPQLTLETGTTDRTINYTSGTTTNTLTFNYTVQAGDESLDLDYKATTSLTLNGGTIKNNGLDAILTLASPGAANSLGANKALVIDTTGPTVTSVSSTTTDGTYKVGDVIAVTVTFSEAVTVTGTPQITLETGITDRTVNYSSGSGSTTLTFNYTVQSGDVSSDLDYTSTTALALNSGTIKDAAGNDATLTLASSGATNSLGANKALVIDGVVPTVTGVSSSTANGTYKVGDIVSVTVTFSEAVTVTGTPQITLETGTTDRTVNYTSGSGGTTLTFNYTIQSGDVSADLDYTTTSALALNSGTIKDGAGNDATLTLASPGAANSLGANKALVIDGVAPTVTSVSSTKADGTYGIGELITITVTFSESVTVTGTPQLALETGAVDRTINYASGSGTNTLSFAYTTQSGDESTDLDYKATNSLSLNGGAIKDGAGNDATLTLASPGAANSLGANKAIVISAFPTVSLSVGNSSIAEASGTSTVTATLSQTSSQDVTVTLAYSGTTTNGTDYNSTASTNITIMAGQLSANATVGITATQDTDAEGDETIIIDITGVSKATENGVQQQTITINDDDAAVVTSVSSTTADGSYKVGDVIAVTVTFNLPVIVTGTPQLTLETGATDRTIDYVSGTTTNTLTFNYTVQAGDESLDLDYKATTSLTLNGGTIKNNGLDAILNLASPGATNSLGANKALVIDGITPTVTVVMANNALKAGETSLVTITFSEIVTGFDNTDLTIPNGTMTAVSSSDGGKTYTATYTPAADLEDATNVITVDNTRVTDVAGNTGTGTTDSSNFTINTKQPTVTVVLADNALNIGETSLVTITFSEIVTGFDNTDLTIPNGTMTTVSSADGGKTYTATFTPIADVEDATNVITVDKAGVANGGGNAGAGTTDSGNFTIDTKRPTVTIVLADNALVAGETSLVTITFSEVVTGFDNTDLTIPNGTMTAVSSADGGKTYAATFTPTAGIEDATNVITMDNTGVTDVAGNSGTGTTDSGNFTINTKVPTVTVVLADNALKAGETSLVTITFSEVVTGFDNTDLTIPNGTMTAVNSSDGGKTYTATFTPTTDIEDATNVITVDNTGVANTGGNAGAGTTDSGNFTIDTKRPTVTIVLADNALTAGETSLVTITFSEVVTGFDNTDLTIPNGTMTAVSSADGGKTYTATFTPTAGIEDATNVITVDNTGVTDVAGNAGVGIKDSPNFTIDTAPPTVPILSSISDDSGVSASDENTMDNTLIFRGTGEIGSSVEVFINGASIGTTTVDVTGAFSFDHSGTALTDATYSITAKATDAVGNVSALSTSLSVIVDNSVLSPIVLSISDDTGLSLTDGITKDRTLVFSGTAEANSTVEIFIDGTSIGSTMANDSGVWTYDHTGTTLANGSYLITAKTTDRAGNVSGLSTVFGVTIDTVLPTSITINTVAGDDVINAVEDDTNTIISGTTLGVEDGGRVDVVVNGITYTATVNSNTWSVTLSSAAQQGINPNEVITASVQDIAGNLGVHATRAIKHDWQLPRVTLTNNVGALTNGAFTVTVDYNEEVSGFVLTDIVLSNGLASDFTQTLAGRVWTLKVTPIANGVVTVDVPPGIAMDNVGNPNISSSQLSTTYDATAPSLTITTPTTSVTGAFIATFTFSEAVTNFVGTDISVTNGTLGGFTTVSSSVYTATITPTASGTVSVSVSADRATDQAGNGNTSGYVDVSFNNAPTDINITANSSFTENNSIGDVAGTLSTVDANTGDTHIYSLVSGTGDADNASFTITGSQLKAAVVFDFEAKSSYSIRLRTNDGNGGTFEKSFIISIIDVAEPDMRITGDLNIPATALGLTSNFNITIHNDGDADLTVSSITYPTAYGGSAGPLTITSGNNQVVTITFSPTAAVVYSGNIVINSNGGTGTLAVSANGAIVTAVEDEAIDESKVNLYPNPTTNKLTIDLSAFSGKPLDISLMDLQGLQHYSRNKFKENTLEIDVSNYTSGVYLILLRTENQVIQKKVMIRQ